ncbi:hypothetical protein [Candidatus Proelusimicrobium volucris]|uniref:hypothetical protein n=1 Tax=Candidatus Proelusimicrobium volucris TaxID=3416225 RepID=UPI003D09F8BD
MNELEAMCPKSRIVKLCGREVEIKALSIKQSIDIWRIINDVKLEGEALKDAPDALRAARILEILGSSKSRDLINIITCGVLKDISNPQEKISLLELSELVQALGEVNDFGRIFVNFTQALKAAAGRRDFRMR